MDPVADMLVRIKNASRAGHEGVVMPSSKLKIDIARVLKENKRIKTFEVVADKKQGMLKIVLRYGQKKEKYFTGVRKISRVSLRRYSKAGDLLSFRKRGYELLIVSTPKGVMTAEAAKAQNVGGEILAAVW